MQEVGFPCSVITSHGEPSQNYSSASAVVLDQMSYSMPLLSMPSDGTSSLQQPMEDGTTISDVAVFELVDMKVWQSSTNNSLQETNQPVILQPSGFVTSRKRKLKRPYSPVQTTTNKKLIDKKKHFKKLKRLVNSADAATPNSVPVKSFSCDKCKSPYIVNPARSHLSNSRKKNYRPRKAIDPVTKDLLLLCNACGLSMSRPKKDKQKKVQPPEDAKRKYLEESIKFGASLAESLHEPDANRLYCPSFKLKPCRCLQNYITSKGVGGTQDRAMHLLALLKDAKNLSKKKNTLRPCKELPEQINDIDNMQSKHNIPAQRGLSKRRCPLFEEFVLSNRLYLRNEVGLCERACQKVLMYSNNFLHKRLKSSPDQGARIERVSGKNARGLLKPITLLANETCCNDKCVRLALTHSKLLESWRLTARQGQREARRVLAEMLTPSGGTKANCYKFIAMITGCSHTTICLVNEQMRRTQGDREPPEHGLKEWWRRHGKVKGKSVESLDQLDSSDGSTNEDDPAICPEVADIHIPSQEEIQMLDPQEASKQLQIQRQKLVQLKKQLTQQKFQIEQQQQKLQKSASQAISNPTVIHTKSTAAAPSVLEAHAGSVGSKITSQQLLHILEIPASTPSVITSVSESNHSQPAISMMTGEFEPLANISVSLGNGQTTFSNVVILPESVLETPVLSQESGSPVSAPSLSYTQSVLESESGHVTSVTSAQSQPHAEFNLMSTVFRAGSKECCDLPQLFYVDN